MENPETIALINPVDQTAKRCYPGSTITSLRSATMSTTSLKLSEELKQRATNAALELGVSPHAFMVEAIRKAADQAEQRSQLVAQAQAARADMLRSGDGFSPDTVREHLRQRAGGRHADAPGTASWRK